MYVSTGGGDRALRGGERFERKFSGRGGGDRPGLCEGRYVSAPGCRSRSSNLSREEISLRFKAERLILSSGWSDQVCSTLRSLEGVKQTFSRDLFPWLMAECSSLSLKPTNGCWQSLHTDVEGSCNGRDCEDGVLSCRLIDGLRSSDPRKNILDATICTIPHSAPPEPKVTLTGQVDLRR